MANKKKFDPYSKPYPPLKPLETILKPQAEETESHYGGHAYVIIPDGVKEISVDVERDCDDDVSINISFHKEREYIPNPNFEKENKVYLEKYKIYKAELKEWKAQKKIYDQEQEEKAKKQREAQYLRLKEEFENEA
jgi:hypothetical protein